MAAFFLFPRDFFAELLDFYRLQNAWVYLYILSLFAFRLFIGQAVAGRRGRKNFKADSRQGGVYGDFGQVRRADLQKAVRAGDALQYKAQSRYGELSAEIKGSAGRRAL